MEKEWVPGVTRSFALVRDRNDGRLWKVTLDVGSVSTFSGDVMSRAFCLLLQYPDDRGAITDQNELIAAIRERM